MKTRLSVIVFSILVLFLSSCTTFEPSASSESQTTNNPASVADGSLPQEIRNISTIGDPYKEPTIEVQRTINCDGNSPKTTFQRSLVTERTTTFEVQVGVGSVVKGSPIPQILEAQLDAQIQAALSRSLGQSHSQTVTVDVYTDAGTADEHTIIWREVKVNGALEVVFPDGVAEMLFQKTIGVELFDRTSVSISCENGLPLQQEPATAIAPPEPTLDNTLSQIPTAAPTVQVIPPPTNVPSTPLPASPMQFGSDDRIPGSGETTLTIPVANGELHTVTSGPICISGYDVCLPGGAYGQNRGSVVVLLPRNEAYFLTGLVPLNNWHGSYYARTNHAQNLAEHLANEMMEKSSSNVNCDGGCDIIDIVIVGEDGVVASYQVQQ